MTNNKTEKTIEYEGYVIQDAKLIKKVQLIEKIENKYLKSAADEFEKSFYEEMIEDNRKEIKFGILSKKEDLTADEKKELEKARNMPITFDEDCPETTVERAVKFKRVNPPRKKATPA